MTSPLHNSNTPMEQPHANTTLEERLRFEELISDLAGRLVNVSGDAIDREITKGLQRIVEFLDAGRSSLSEFSGDSGSLRVTHSYQTPGIDPTPGMIMHERFPWYTKTLWEGTTIIAPNLPDDFPPGSAVRDYVAKVGLKSHLAFSLRSGETIIGALHFASFHRYRDWPEDLIARLCLVGELFTNVLQRKRKEEQLRNAYLEIRELKQRLEQENIYLREELTLHRHYSDIIGKSEVMMQMLQQVEQVADSDSTVLIQGETGTGKELIAQAIHRSSPRKKRTLVIVNCAALPSNLIESELFGREKGAYTGAMSQQAGRFELADGSTIVLDEIGELPLELQPKLLRVLQQGQFERLGSSKSRKVNVRVIASTNRDLAQMVKEGSFRQDLFYRLNVFPIVVPPLRERPEDIPLLIQAFLKQLRQKSAPPIERIPRKTMKALQGYPWPGNIRELRNVIEHALLISKGSALHIRLPEQTPASGQQDESLEEVERRHILKVLERSDWRVSGRHGAAERLKLKPTTLEYRMKKIGIRRPKR